MRKKSKMKANEGLIIAVTAVIFSVLLFPGRSFGWGKTWLGANLEQIVNAAHWKMGSFRYNAAFRLTNAGYDSDIYFGSTLNPVPDYTFTAGPEVRVYLLLKKGIVFDISEIPQYVFYLYTKQARALNNAFRGQVHFALERLYFQAGGGLINAKERISTELNIPVRRKQNDLAGQAFWQISEGSAVALQYRSFTFEYENPTDGSINLRENLNRKSSYINFAAYLQLVSGTRFYLDAEYGSFVFREPISSFKDSRSYSIFGGVEFLPAQADKEQIRGIQGRINLGYKSFDILDPQLKDYKGLVGNTSIAINIIKFTTLRGVFARDIQFSVYSDIPYYIQTVYGAGFSRAFTSRINLTYDLSFSRNDYAQLEDNGSRGARLDKYITHVFGLGFKLRKDLELNLMASLSTRSSNLVEEVNHRNFIGFNLTYGYSPGGISMLASPFSR
ncbi:MAG: outer membrane beta-barrel protein [Candidatus Aminicenantales bacterium]